MHFTQYHDPAAFMAVAQPVFEEDECRHSLMLGIGLQLMEKPDAHGPDPLLGIVEQNGGPSLIAMMTRRHQILLNAADAAAEQTAAAECVAQALHEAGRHVPAVLSTDALAQAFATRWTKLSGVPHKVHMRQCIHELRTVRHPEYAPGHFRAARPDEVELMTDWTFGFYEAVHLSASEDRATLIEQMAAQIEAENLYVWEDGDIVSMARRVRPTPRGCAIGGVYTPSECRGRGYASSCVARLSQLILDRGKEYVCLFTDLANPTSNHIYANIGYCPVCDLLNLVFE